MCVYENVETFDPQDFSVVKIFWLSIILICQKYSAVKSQMFGCEKVSGIKTFRSTEMFRCQKCSAVKNVQLLKSCGCRKF